MKDSNEMVKELFERREKYYIERQRKMGNLKKVVGSLSCCLVVIFVVGIPISNYFSSLEDVNSSVGDSIQNIEADYPPSIKKEMAPDNIDNPENADSESQNGETEPRNDVDDEPDGETASVNTTDGAASEGVSIDIPEKEYHEVPAALNNPGSTGALVPYEAVWGGSYPNEAGQWVVLLTENTAENQKRVFALNPSLTEDNTIFKTAAYSLSYLEGLMQSISQAMDSDEEMPFVFSVGLKQEKNCIQVDVTTDDPESIEKILAFDTLGGAIEIVNINNFVVPEGVQKGPMP